MLSIAFSPNGKFLASTSEAGILDGAVRLWNAESGRKVRTFAESKTTIFSVKFSPDGWLVATGSSRDDNIVRLYYVASGREAKQFEGESLFGKWNRENRSRDYRGMQSAWRSRQMDSC
jgi:WD40 repeat protein